MTVLQSLAGYYDRMAARGEVPPDGYSSQPIDYALVIDADGVVIDVTTLRRQEGKRSVRRQLNVPNPQRTSNIMPNVLWDKTAYLFGVTAGNARRTAEEHDEFRKTHMDLLSDAWHEDLVAFKKFIERWRPDQFDQSPFSLEMKDANFVVSVTGTNRYVHDSEEARALAIAASSDTLPDRICLVRGVIAPVARLHPIIKNVRGGQSSGGSLVSFNAASFISYGQLDGAGAPTSAESAARYGSALNRLLLSPANKTQIGDATVVFWADTGVWGEAAAQAAEEAMSGLFGGARFETDHDASEAIKLHGQLKLLAEGRPVTIGTSALHPQTRIHILGLSPNAARLSVRFWLTQDLAALAANLARHEEDCRVEPLPWRTPPSINRLLVNTTAAQEKWDNIPPQLAGEVARAVLGGGRYPRTLLTTAIMRLRAGDDPAGGWHAAAIRAVLAREFWFKRKDKALPEDGETPVSLDRDHLNTGYQLGRLFAAFELAQRSALGRNINKTIRDSYYGSASATPASIFPLIISNGQNHLAKIRKEKPGWAVTLERELEEIMGRLTPVMPFSIPRSLRIEDQGEFAIGYYHQRKAKLGKDDEDVPGFDEPAHQEGED